MSETENLTSLYELLSTDGAITPSVVALMRLPAVEALLEAHSSGRPATAALRNKFGEPCKQHEPYSSRNVDFFFDNAQRHITAVTQPDVDERLATAEYGRLLTIIAQKHPVPRRITRIAQRCESGEITTIPALRLALERSESTPVYLTLIAALAAALAALWILAH